MAEAGLAVGIGICMALIVGTMVAIGALAVWKAGRRKRKPLGGEETSPSEVTVAVSDSG